MSRAFTREETNENAIADLGERPVSSHRNLVTPGGLAAIDNEIATLRSDLKAAEGEGDKTRIAVLARDLRYWLSRRETAELVPPEEGSEIVRFGVTVSLEDEDGKQARWRIVGEDEADPSKGSISHVSPMARALFGKGIDEAAVVNGREWEIVGLE